MSDGMNCNGVIVPWTEYFFKGYTLDKVKAILTDAEINSRMESIYYDGMIVNPITEQRMSTDKGTPYMRYQGHRYFFNTTHSTASINVSSVYKALGGTGIGSSLSRAFDSDDSDEAELFDRHVKKVMCDWWKAKSATPKHIELHKRIEDKINKLNSVGWELLKNERT